MELPSIVDDDEGAFADAARAFHDTMDAQVLQSNWRAKWQGHRGLEQPVFWDGPGPFAQQFDPCVCRTSPDAHEGHSGRRP